jgi:hypothetical protein
MVLFFAELVLKGLPEQPDGARIGLGIDHVPGIRICFFKLPGSGGFFLGTGKSGSVGMLRKIKSCRSFGLLVSPLSPPPGHPQAGFHTQKKIYRLLRYKLPENLFHGIAMVW